MNIKTSMYQFIKNEYQQYYKKDVIYFYGKKITFEAFIHKVDLCAAHLQAHGVTIGTVVTIHLPNIPQALIAIYAISKLGAINHIVHPMTPLDLLEKSMHETKSHILISTDMFLHKNIPTCKTIIVARISEYFGGIYRWLSFFKPKSKMGTDFSKLTQETPNMDVGLSQDLLADTCVCYMNSSGTTNSPKIVMHSNQSLNAWVANTKSFHQNKELATKSLYGLLPIFHGSGLCMNVHQSLTYKMLLILDVRFQPKRMIRMLKRWKIAFITAVPYICERLLKEKSFQYRNVKYLEQCFVAGDTISLALKEAFNRRCNPDELKNYIFEGYGMTEIVTACFANGYVHNKIASSGYPLEHCYIAVKDQENIFYADHEGELLVSTNTMMLGYLNDKATTNSVFETIGDKQWLHTGDYGYIDQDGYVYFKERIKHMIIIKGINVFPSEIEQVLEELPEIKQVAIVGITDGASNASGIKAYVVPVHHENAGALLQETIIQYATKKLMPIAIPKQIVFQKALPVNALGKIDYQALIEEGVGENAS